MNVNEPITNHKLVRAMNEMEKDKSKENFFLKNY